MLAANTHALVADATTIQHYNPNAHYNANADATYNANTGGTTNGDTTAGFNTTGATGHCWFLC